MHVFPNPVTYNKEWVIAVLLSYWYNAFDLYLVTSKTCLRI